MTVRGPSTPPPEAVRAELERILDSPLFADSPRMAGFLTYVVEAKLAGDEDRIQEYAIGLAVFERPESFDPRTDSIVRVEARRLRDRLARFYETDSTVGSVRIELPRRGYVPKFVSGAEPTAQEGTAKRTVGSVAPWAVAAAFALFSGWVLVGRAPESPTDRVRTIEFLIPPPDDAGFVPVGVGGGAVVSPDGRRIAFVAGVAEGERRLYVRDLDDAAPRALEGTERAKWPFWSPDSAALGFEAGDRLRTVEVESGLIVNLADAPDYAGGAWGGPNGDVVLFGSLFGPIRKVTASGQVEDVTQLQPEEYGHRWPEFLPGGERFLFVKRLPPFPEVQLALGSLDAGEVNVVATTHSQALYTERSNGSILFARDGTLFEQGFNLGRGRLRGEPRPLVEKVNRSSVLHGKYDFSASRSGVLSYRQREAYLGLSELLWYDRAGRVLDRAAERDHYFYFSLSPDERTIAVTMSIDGNVDLWTLDLQRGVRQRRTRHPALDRTPIWSPDGETILFNSSRNGGQLHTVPRDGGSLADFPAPRPGDDQFGGWPSDWSRPDQVLFASRGLRFNKGVLYGIRPGSKARILLEGDFAVLNAKRSVDDLVAFASDESGRREIWLAPLADMDRRIQVSNIGGNYPLWRGDGRELYYIAPDGLLMAVEVGRDMTVSAPKMLFQLNLPFSPAPTIYRYAVSKDGQRFLCQNLTEQPSPAVRIDLN